MKKTGGGGGGGGGAAGDKKRGRRSNADSAADTPPRVSYFFLIMRVFSLFMFVYGIIMCHCVFMKCLFLRILWVSDQRLRFLERSETSDKT